ncbi:hypothetical protein GCM10010510_67440 [Streptomyces anandii JCM 4720]|nr:hypothetical protein GCM10010510_67440 [Streptomyces anandii JCM 4720]
MPDPAGVAHRVRTRAGGSLPLDQFSIAKPGAGAADMNAALAAGKNLLITVGKATRPLVVNTNNAIIDHSWIWRADHGADDTVGWNTNTADTGLVVNGQNVTAYGLFVAHFQKTRTIWNGNGGRT